MITTTTTPTRTRPPRWRRIRFRLRAMERAALHTAELTCQIDEMRELARAVEPILAWMAEGEAVDATDPHDARLWLVLSRQAGLLPLADGSYRGARSLVSSIAQAILAEESEVRP